MDIGIAEKINMLENFYSTMQKDKVKLETKCHGFGFLDDLMGLGGRLEYGQQAEGLVFKYKLLDVSKNLRMYLLHEHIIQTCNVCMYFDPVGNNVCCFNIDDNRKVIADSGRETRAGMEYLVAFLEELGIQPLVSVSGKGYHVWCRFDSPVDNAKLYNFLIVTAARTLSKLHDNKLDYQVVKFTVYPNTKITNLGSLRLFGSEHVRTHAFSNVYTSSGILNEGESWRYMADFLTCRVTSVKTFDEAYIKVRL